VALGLAAAHGPQFALAGMTLGGRLASVADLMHRNEVGEVIRAPGVPRDEVVDLVGARLVTEVADVARAEHFAPDRGPISR
jgi:hypothetical protein